MCYGNTRPLSYSSSILPICLTFKVELENRHNVVFLPGVFGQEAGDRGV
jgi:hypothetical protein